MFARGLRYFRDRPVRLGDLSVRPDFVFPRLKIAVFVDGCFWHRCPDHYRPAKARAAFWQAKIEANVARDRRTDEALRAVGWQVVRAWEHEPADEVAAAIGSIVAERSGVVGTSRIRR
jgi:DNA mismatch endonuclease (patch repair protein)